MKLKRIFTLALIAGISNPASALTIQNSSFETGDFLNWDITAENDGSAFVSSSFDLAPMATDGVFFAELNADSTLSQQVSWSQGDAIHFDWYFSANDALPYNDFSLFFVLDDLGAEIDTVTIADVSTVGDYADSGWQTFSYNFNYADSGTLGFGVYNDIDTFGGSTLYIDNITVSSVPVTAPMLLLTLGLSMLTITRRQSCTK